MDDRAIDLKDRAGGALHARSDGLAMPRLTELRARLLPSDLAVVDGNSGKPLWDSVVSMATRSIRAGFTFEEYSDLMFGSDLGHRLCNDERTDKLKTRGRFDAKLSKAWDYAEENYDHGYKPAGLPEDEAASLRALLPGAGKALTAIIEIALETGHHPVTASVRQVATRTGQRLEVVVAEMRQLQDSAGPDSPVLKVTQEKGFRKARWWTLNVAYRGDICVPPLSHMQSSGNARNESTCPCSGMAPGKRFSTAWYSTVAGCSAQTARKRLAALEAAGDVYRIRGDRRKREPDVWVKQEPWEVRQKQAQERVEAVKRKHKAPVDPFAEGPRYDPNQEREYDRTEWPAPPIPTYN